jgi:hypothetical protein
MELSPEVKRKIYEEEKARIEAEQASQNIKPKSRVDTDEPTRNQRITTSSVIIACSIALLILFYMFRQYLAYFQVEQRNGVAEWVRYEIFTADFFQVWLPFLTATLILYIIGHIVAIVFDRYIVRQSITIGVNLLAIGTILYLLSLFPFDFASVPSGGGLVLSIAIRIIIITILIILSLVTLVNFIKLIVRVVTRTATY